MNSNKNILPRFLFVLLILFCAGMEVQSYACTYAESTELTTNQNDDNIQTTNDQDMFDDDHFSLNFEFCRFDTQFCSVSGSSKPFIFSGFTDSGWRPPQF